MQGEVAEGKVVVGIVNLVALGHQPIDVAEIGHRNLVIEFLLQILAKRLALLERRRGRQLGKDLFREILAPWPRGRILMG